MSAAGLPDAVDGGQHRRRAPIVTGQRVGLIALLVAVAVATVAVPPLITPSGDKPAAAPPVPFSQPPSPSSPSKTPPSPSPAPRKALAACAPVAEGSSVEVTARPSCVVYGPAVGNGWRATGDGLKVIPGEFLPGRKERGLRVERTRPALDSTAMALVAATPVGLRSGDTLKLRVWGGREFGTVLRVGVTPGSGTVKLTAPAERWTSYSIKLADLTSRDRLSRIDLVVAADEVPNVTNFFLDDITLR
ncbi:hypothetical protein [Actinoplanes friuliensis]|uniref:hypothetical protein n=1 Tax=Actinoplanes friuliensis TaxID=196914 RepID=UPI0004226C29|nr:hypothetical protein [Actinoplanes friuliensis]